MILTSILEHNAKKYPHSTACLMHMGFRTTTLSYRQMYELAQKIAILFEQEGVNKGDKVLICAPNSPYWIAVFWGVVLRGAVVVPLTTQSTPDMIKRFAQHTNAKVLFKSMIFSHALEGGKTFDVETIKDQVAGFNLVQFNPVDMLEDDVVQILYTSGTTGDPKGVVLTHRNMMAEAQIGAKLYTKQKRYDIMVSVLPLSHIFEQIGTFLIPYILRIPFVHAHSPSAIRSLMHDHRVTMMMIVPEFLKILMSKIEAEAEKKNKHQQFERMVTYALKIPWNPLRRLLFRSVHAVFGGRLRWLVSGGAPLDPELEHRWNALGVTVLQGYGLSETSGAVTLNSFTEQRPGSVGRVLPGMQIKLTDDGEILIKGPTVFQGYYNDEAKTKQAFTDDGWFCTGDMGYFDNDGYLFLKGRKKYMIIGSGGQNVFPEDLETELNKVAGVVDSCVVGLESAHGTLDIHAVLLLTQNAPAPEKIIEEANKHLATYQHITGWTVWPEQDFPRSVTRKIKKENVIHYLKEQTKETVVHAGAGRNPLITLLAQLTGVDRTTIHETTRLIPDLKLDSLLRIELVVRIEEEYGVTIDEHDIRAHTTVVDLEKIIAAGSKTVVIPPLRQWPFSWWARVCRIFGLGLLDLLGRVFFKLRVEGLEYLKDIQGPVLLMPNHVSNLDGIIVGNALPWHLRKRLAFAAAVDVLYEHPDYKKFTFLAELFFNAFPFPRTEQENIKPGLMYMGQMLDRGQYVVIFPEGKISDSGNLQPFKRGSGLVAIEMDVPVIPIKICDLNALVGPDDFFPKKRGVVTVKIGKPIKFMRGQNYTHVTEQLEQVMKGL